MTGTALDAIDPFVFRLSIFVLAVFVGYYVVWSVTPALHTPLMSVTNAISSVIIVGALIAAGPEGLSVSKLFGFLAVILAAVNIFGGFLVTQRLLQMFKKAALEGTRAMHLSANVAAVLYLVSAVVFSLALPRPPPPPRP